MRILDCCKIQLSVKWEINQMEKWWTSLLLLLVLSCAQEPCIASHFDFTGNYTLGKQDELNRTFTKVQEKIQLGNVTFNSNETTTFTIFNIRTSFFYRDSNQMAKITGNDTIIITGGAVEAALSFNWTKVASVKVSGTAQAKGVSDVISFAKLIVIGNDSFYSYDLLDAPDVTWSSGDMFSINRVDPPNVSQEDISILTRMLNNIMKVKTVRLMLEEEIDRYYNFYLRASLHDEHQPINTHFDYVWSPRGKPNVTIPFTRKAVTVDIEVAGIQLTFEVRAADDKEWKCGTRPVHMLPLRPDVYGHSQQFVSFDFYQSVLRYAISKNLLDTDLNRESWESTMFQFFAGDLYEVLPLVQSRFFASEFVIGNCKATYQGLSVTKANFDTFNVSIHFDCELNIYKQKVLSFAVGLVAEVVGIARESTMDFRLRSHQQFVTFYPYGDYKTINEDLAKLMVKHSLNRLYEGNLFGSGWPMSPPRDYPHMMTEQNYTVVYDSTHVDPHQESTRIE